MAELRKGYQRLFSVQRKFDSPLGCTGGAFITITAWLGTHPGDGPGWELEITGQPYDTRKDKKYPRPVEHKRFHMYWMESSLDQLRVWIANQGPLITHPFRLKEREAEINGFLGRVSGRLKAIKMHLEKQQAADEEQLLSGLRVLKGIQEHRFIWNEKTLELEAA